MKWSQTLIPTVKETPSDAEVVSHKLMIRAGMLRKVSAGIYNYLPLALRVIRNVENIIREEMNRSSSELLMPILSPAELWHETGRWGIYGKELMRVTDRKDNQYALGPTHEEVVTDIVRNELNSYKQLPICLYQIQDKFRDEVRPRFGVMRGREFIMKDGYSFHDTAESLDEFYKIMYETYTRIFRRCGLRFRAVLADSGAIGGKETHEFMVLAESGESRVLACPDTDCAYAATDETAEGRIARRATVDGDARMEKIATPGKKTIEDVAEFLGVAPFDCGKAVCFVDDDRDGKFHLVLVRGDRQVNEPKLMKALEAPRLRAATDDEIKKACGCEPGYLGPVGMAQDVSIVADLSLRDMPACVVGANEPDYHYVRAVNGRDFRITAFYDVATVEPGDGCPKCGKPLEAFRGIEVGQIFKLGTRYSESMNAKFLDRNGKEKPFIMGCYGIGVTRTVAAAIEQNHDENGIVWPQGIAPYAVVVTSLKPTVDDVAEKIYRELAKQGIDVLYDDRPLRPGFKLKDADLIGIPYRITVGPNKLTEGVVEIRNRATGEDIEAAPELAAQKIAELLKKE